MYQLSNDSLKISIHDKGAELQSIFHQQHQLEYLWSGDPAFWGKKSPVLFPIVGGLKHNSYRFNDRSFTLGRHGFARDKVFSVKSSSDDTIVFVLTSDEESLSVYPFPFSFSIRYHLTNDTLHIGYIIENTGVSNMYFSIGAHPAFAVPLVKGSEFEDYYLLFNKNENTSIWPLAPEGLIKDEPIPFLQGQDRLPLKKSLFYKDALVFKSLQSDSISILSHQHEHGLTVSYTGFPYMGIWSTKEADFVCIEPWCGIADSVNSNGHLQDKEGIFSLHAGEIFERSWSIRVF